MKKYLSLVFVLSVATSITSCTERKDGRAPDAVYERTYRNPELGASSSMSEPMAPISESIGSSTRLFSGKSSSSSEKPAQKKTKLIGKTDFSKPREVQPEVKEEVASAPQEAENLPLPAPVAENEPVVVEQKVTAEVDQQPAQEPAQAEQKLPAAVGPEVHETNLSILNMKPVSPDESVQVINIEQNGVKKELPVEQYVRAEQPAPAPQAQQQDEVVNVPADEWAASTKQEAKAEEQAPAPVAQEEVKQEEPAQQVVAEQPVRRLPASMAYKMQQNVSAEKAEEKDEPTVIEKVANLFTRDEKEAPKKEEKAVMQSSNELPEAETTNVGECMAKVTAPGEQKEVEETIIVTPEKQKEVVTPAVYKDVTENVLVTPGQKTWKKVGKNSDLMQVVEEDAVYKTVTKKVLVEEEKREVITTPAVTKTVKKMVAVSEDKVEWMPALCENKLDRDTTKRIQGALITKGYDIRIVDGSLGPITKKALYDYQQNYLGINSTAITLKTIDSLGLMK